MLMPKVKIKFIGLAVVTALIIALMFAFVGVGLGLVGKNLPFARFNTIFGFKQGIFDDPRKDKNLTTDQINALSLLSSNYLQTEVVSSGNTTITFATTQDAVHTRIKEPNFEGLFIEPMNQPKMEVLGSQSENQVDNRDDNQTDKKSVNQYVFTDSQTGTKFVYTLKEDELKQDIILPQSPQASQFTVYVVTKGMEVDIDQKGRAVFADAQGLARFILIAPWAKDAGGSETKKLSYKLNQAILSQEDLASSTTLADGAGVATKATNIPNTVKDEQLGGGFSKSLDTQNVQKLVAEGSQLFNLELVVDEEWLKSPQRVYPITIDPSVQIGTPLNYSQQSKYCPPGNTETNCDALYQPAPLAEYYFDDATGTTVKDSTANGYTGTFTGSGTGGTTWTRQGKINFAGLFNGTDDFVDVGTGPTGIKSVGFWVYPATTTEYFVDLNGSAYIWANAGTLTATGFTSPTVYINGVKATTIEANKWQYVAVTSATAVDATDLDLGRLEGTDYFAGRLDHARFYNYVRTPAQVAWDFNAGAPVTWYKFNENTGTAIGDWGVGGDGYRGNNLTLTVGAGGTYDTATQVWANGNPGKIAISMDLDGTDDYASTANVALLASNSTTYTNLSWGAWVKPRITVTRTIIHKNNEFRLRLTDVSVPSCQIYASSAWQTGAVSGGVIPTNSWSHILCAYDGANIKVYVNGVLRGTQPLTNAVTSTSATAINVGRDSGGSEYFSGAIDEARVYSYALTPIQAKTAKNDGIVAYGRAPVTAELPQSFICGKPITVQHVASNGVAPVDKTVSYGTVLTGIGGTGDKCWITQNLGATNQASTVSDATEASAGWYWQFNRKQGYKHDGTTRTPATAWNATEDNTYTGWDPAKDPCALELGAGWRLPTSAEWTVADVPWTTWQTPGPWDLPLRIHAAGYLDSSSGALTYRGTFGSYWSSTQSSATNGYRLRFGSGYSTLDFFSKANGLPVRCLRNL